MPPPHASQRPSPDRTPVGSAEQVAEVRVQQARAAISVTGLVAVYLWAPLRPEAALAALVAAALYDLVGGRHGRHADRGPAATALGVVAGLVPSILILHELAEGPWAGDRLPVPLWVAVAAQVAVAAWAIVASRTLDPAPGPAADANRGAVR